MLSIGRRPILLSARTELLVSRRRISRPLAAVGILHLDPLGPPSGLVDGIRLLCDGAFEVQLRAMSALGRLRYLARCVAMTARSSGPDAWLVGLKALSTPASGLRFNRS
jgi:hypothetical protein